MLSNLAAALITHGRIQTTLTKARALRPFIEKVITKAKHAAGKSEKKDAVHLRRLALRDVRDEDAVTLLFNEKYKEFENRAGGYTRIYKLGPQRLGDAAEMALIEFVKADDVGLQEVEGAPVPCEEEPQAEGRRACGGRRPRCARGARGRDEGLSQLPGFSSGKKRAEVYFGALFDCLSPRCSSSQQPSSSTACSWPWYFSGSGSSMTGGTTCVSSGSAGGRPSIASGATGSTRRPRGRSCATARGAGTRTLRLRF